MTAGAHEPTLETKLLDLQVEYASHEEKVEALRHLGLSPDRSRDEIAREYGQVLRQFING